MTRFVAAVVAGLAISAAPPAAAADGPDHIVVVTLAGVTWAGVRDANTPVLDRLVRQGAVAAISVRSAAARTNPVRGYLSLGAGNRAYARDGDPHADLVFGADAAYENGTAAEALARRTRDPRQGGVVHVGVPWLASEAKGTNFGTRIGSLGETLARGGVPRAVVSAADLSPAPASAATRRRAAALAIVDRQGSVDAGTVAGLVRADPAAPWGVRTDPDLFATAVAGALDAARVVVVETGETPRADEIVPEAAPDAREAVRIGALERADALLGRVASLLGPRDRMYVVAISGPFEAPTEHLTPLIAYGQGVGRGWLTSATTRRLGIATLSDLAPTIVRAMGLSAPASFTGTTLSVRPGGRIDRVARLADLDRQSVFRERFAALTAYLFIAVLITLAFLSFAVFGTRSRPAARVLLVVAYVTLSVPPATLIARSLEVDRLGMGWASAVQWGIAGALAVAALLLPGPRWAGGVALLVLSAVMLSADVITGSRLQLNGVFGVSPIVAGRFYGVGNLGFAILMASGILGLTGVLDLRGYSRAPAWTALPLAALIVVDGLPQLGADFGGILAGVPAVIVTYSLARGRRVRWRTLVAVGVAAVGVAASLALVDLARPPAVRTHLGRFAGQVVSGGFPALWMVIARKAEANIRLWALTPWTYTIPILVGVLAMLMWRPVGVLRDVIASHPVLRAGLWGSLVAGIVGYTVNDSGVAIPAMVMAHVVPLFVLMGLQKLVPRGTRPS